MQVSAGTRIRSKSFPYLERRPLSSRTPDRPGYKLAVPKADRIRLQDRKGQQGRKSIDKVRKEADRDYPSSRGGEDQPPLIVVQLIHFGSSIIRYV
jgi:hypothetical protein